MSKSLATFDHLQLAREKLDPNNLEAGLPGRESQSAELYTFLVERLKIRQTAAERQDRVKSGQVANIKGRHMNKTIFVCGVPGTGKTATIMYTVHKVEKLLGRDLPTIHNFVPVYVNGQYLSKAERIYTEIIHQLTKENMSPEKAQDKLKSILTSEIVEPVVAKSRRKSKKGDRVPTNTYVVVILDELDLLYSEKKQGVFYSLFDWAASADYKLIFIAIANAMDLPERFAMGRMTSRMGWDKLVFESYTSGCLSNIIRARLGEELMNKCFDKNAIIVATHRIGRTTGDARRVLDTCRLAIDQALKNKSPRVTAAIIDKVGFQNIDLNRHNYINTCTPLQLMVLKSILKETERLGEENVNALGVFQQLVHMLSRHNYFKGRMIGPEMYMKLLHGLAGVGLIYAEENAPNFQKRISIKDSSEMFVDRIRTQKIDLDEE